MPWVPIAMAAAGALAGKAKNDRANAVENSDRTLASATQRYSPWTGMQAGQIHHAGSAFGDVFGGGVGGAMMGQSLANGMGSMGSAPGTPMAGGTAGMGAQEMGQTMSPMDRMQMQQNPNYGQTKIG